jgi:magnesium transporter
MWWTSEPTRDEIVLTQFSRVNPLYYVTFTTCTLVASFILFRGFNTTDTVNTISLLCGFLTIFTGVYLLNLSREDPDGVDLGIRSKDDRGGYHEVDGIPVDAVAGFSTRMSMQARRSTEGLTNGSENHRRSGSWSLRSPITGRWNGSSDQQHLMHSYDIEAANGLAELAEDSDEDSGSGRKRTSFEDANGHRQEDVAGSSSFGAPRRTRTMDSERVNMGGKSFDKTRR